MPIVYKAYLDSLNSLVLSGKESTAMQEILETQVWSLGQEDLLEEEMATHSSILAWRIPWTEEPGGLQSIGSQRDKNGQLSRHNEFKITSISIGSWLTVHIIF